jgi:hypothetical protein
MNHTTRTALALAMAALAGTAQAEFSLTGSVDFAVQNTDGDWRAGTAGAGRNQLTFASRDDLGEGNYAFTHLQTRFKLTDGTISTGGNYGNEVAKSSQVFRNAHVGIGGAFGELRLGRLVMPMNLINGDFDPFGTDYLGGVHTDAIKATVRANGAIEYFSPTVAGFSAVVGVAGNNAQMATEAVGSVPLGTSLRYKDGDLDLAVALDRNVENLKTQGLYASYKLASGVRLMTQYERGDWSATRTLKVGRWSTGVNVPIGKLLLRAGYIRKSDEDASKVGLGGDYFMFKQTSFYSDISKQSGAGNQDTALLSDANRKVRFEVGMRHRF